MILGCAHDDEFLDIVGNDDRKQSAIDRRFDLESLDQLVSSPLTGHRPDNGREETQAILFEPRGQVFLVLQAFLDYPIRWLGSTIDFNEPVILEV